MLKRTPRAGILALLLAGCAAAPVAQGPLPVNPAYSRALNLAIAVGETDEPTQPFLIDRPVAEVAQLNQAAAIGGGEHPAVTLGYAAANALNPPPGITPAVGAGFSVLSLLTSLPTYTPGQMDQVYVWAPVELGATSEQTLAAVFDRVCQTYAAAISPGYRLAQNGAHCGLDSAWLEGPGCNQQTCALWRTSTPASNHPVIDPPAVIRHPGKIYAPWRLAIAVIHPPGHPPPPPALANPSLGQWRAFSQTLPEWMAVYLAPKAGRNGVPLVLYRGETLAFVQPGT
jgi:hypothetical protein